MNLGDQFLWVIFPYMTLVIFIVGLLMRYNTDQQGWTSKSSQFLEKRLLKWGNILFHIGIIFVLFGHIGGLLVPLKVYRMLGVPDEQYHLMATVMGGLSGLIASIGLAILIYRRFLIKRIRLTSSVSDMIAIILLAIVVFNGLLVTITNSMNETGFDYRTNISPWLRGLLTLRPDASLMSQVPLVFKVHIFTAFTFFAALPFTRMVHMFSAPIAYLVRSYIVYRKRR